MYLALLGLLFVASALQAGLEIVRSHGSQRDFRVYFIAASMIRNHEGSHIYNQAANGADPELAWADPNTLFAGYARKLGVDNVRLYVFYPPLLADMLVPLASLRLASSRACVACPQCHIYPRRDAPNGKDDRSEPGSLVLAPSVRCSSAVPSDSGLFIFGSNYDLAPSAPGGGPLLLFGKQDFLCGSHVCGHYRDQDHAPDRRRTAARVPGLEAITGIWLGFSGAAHRHLPGERRRTLEAICRTRSPVDVDRCRLCAEQESGHCAADCLATHTPASRPSIHQLVLEKLLSLAVICYAGWLSRCTPKSDFARKTTVLMLFFLLGCCLAPVAWRHSYVLAAPALAVLVGKAWKGRMNAVEFIALCCFVPLVLGFGFTQWASDTRNPLLLDAAMLGPVAGIALTLALLYGRPRASLPLDEESLL